MKLMKKILQPIIIASLIGILSGLLFFYLYNRNARKDFDCQMNLLSEGIDQKKYFIYGLHTFLFTAEDDLIIKKQTKEIYEILQIYDKIITGIDNLVEIRAYLDSFVKIIRYNQKDDRDLEKMEEILSSINYQNKNNIINRVMLVMNHILDKFMGMYISSTYPIAGLKVVNVAKQNTIKYGEYYESRILYDVLDLSMGKMIVIDEKDTLYSGNFKEQALKRGKNKREGKQYFVFKDRLQVFGFEIEYFVE